MPSFSITVVWLVGWVSCHVHELVIVYFEGFNFRYCTSSTFWFCVRWWSFDVIFNETLENDITQKTFSDKVKTHIETSWKRGNNCWGKLLCSRCLELDRGDLVPVVKDHFCTWKTQDPLYLISPCLHLWRTGDNGWWPSGLWWPGGFSNVSLWHRNFPLESMN